MKGIQHIKNGVSNDNIEFFDTNKKQGGFFDLNKEAICNDKEHKPPMYIHIPQGKGYKHVCPACGKETIIIPPQISL